MRVGMKGECRRAYILGSWLFASHCLWTAGGLVCHCPIVCQCRVVLAVDPWLLSLIFNRICFLLVADLVVVINIRGWF